MIKFPLYEEMNGGAHRQPASILGAPSIVRHLAFWDVDPAESHVWTFPPGTVFPPQYPGLTHQEDRRAKYRDYLKSLQQRLESKKSEVQIVESFRGLDRDPSDFGKNSVDVCKFWWQAIRVTVRLEMYTEYITITTILDLSVKRPHHIKRSRWKRHPTKNLIRAVYRLGRDFNSRQAQQPEDWSDLRERLLTNIWLKFDRKLLDHKNKTASLGCLFADFRGLVTGTQKPFPGNRKRLFGLSGTRQLFRPPFMCPEPVGSVGKEDPLIPDDKWRRDALRRLWPLIRSEHGTDKFEFTASGYLDGRAVFVSALGPQPRDQSGQTGNSGIEQNPAPVNYYLHTDTWDEWQLGRLVNRIHNLATLRLAAIARIGALMKAGEIVEEVVLLMEVAGEKIQTAMNKLSVNRPRGKEGQLKYDKAMREPKTAIDVAEKRLAEINNMFPMDITARLERSKGYVERFRAGTNMFRVKRIEGFQLYNEFVFRRMGGLFSYTELLNRRMNDLWSIRAKMHQRYANFKTATTTCEISKITQEISKIQDFGEIALVGILVPYYLGNLILHIFEGNLEGKEGRYWGFVTCVFALYAAIRLAMQAYAQAKDSKPHGNSVRQSFVFSLLFIAFIGAIIFAAKSLPLKEKGPVTQEKTRVDLNVE